MRAAVLVEGRSDSAALERLAARRGRDLAAEGVAIVGMGGATNIRRYLELLGPRGQGLALAGLCDAAEVGYFRRGLAAVGLGSDLSLAQMRARGFHVCVADLEDELIRALGTDAVEAVIADRGELNSFRTMQRQPAQRDRPLEAQLRRFLGTRGGRKIAYAPALVDALDLARVPAPLDGVLAAV
ncbi:ATP-dependent endonuclease [Occultella glacieicola]|uniref:ATP-dependent endonuclease n=1 Tax=Occultella glacieicola TaxID=2518684 RepID=A0ABY2E0M6_9MICO|nr:TOPRIM nucleotidyl transferase/hydrolase domain-containing protein [Occultella glacieicola]TDE88772.1 ATP-dependent endonuclease [Occultella glacieicola]